MKKYWWILGLVSFVLMAAGPKKYNYYRTIDNRTFGGGEHLKYYAHYGFIKAAEGEVFVDRRIASVNDRPCYKVDIYGQTTSFFDVIARVRNHWGSYIDTAAIIPQKFYRYIDEGEYKRNEIMEYDHKNDSLFVHVLDRETRQLDHIERYAVPDNVQDVVSGFFYLRTIDFNRHTPGDTLAIDGFYKNKVFDFKVRYVGKETIKTKLGKIRAIKIAPVMPKNSVFDGKDSIHLWLSDDDNKIPLKVRSEMFVGAIELDIKYASGLKNPLNKI